MPPGLQSFHPHHFHPLTCFTFTRAQYMSTEKGFHKENSMEELRALTGMETEAQRGAGLPLKVSLGEKRL